MFRIWLLATATLWPASAAISFNRDVRPIMADTCFRCHGPDKSSRMAGMRLDLRDEALKPNKAGAAPIVPGDPEKSAVIARVFSTNPAKLMPPKSAHKELTERQKQTLRQWVAEGAIYEGHWAYTPVRRPAIPETAAAAQPVDAFIRARLAAEGLSPSPAADKRTLIRRVTLDLTGLPPTREEVQAFLSDTSAGAYAALVDRLLASPRYAEKQAIHWLDAVRYADTSGFHGDQDVPAWPYRDWVLKAFRDNMPFDQFTREQLAGDLLENATPDQRVASAYNRMSRMSSEGGIQPKEYLAKYAADRVRTVSSVWLGATMGCSECHDHKFDPILSRDFYSMKAFFADIKETGLVQDKGPNAWGSKLRLPSSEQEGRAKELETRIAAAREALAAKAGELAGRQAGWESAIQQSHARGELAWRYQRPLSARSQNGATLTIYNDALVDANFYIVGPMGASLSSERYRGEGLVVARGANPDNETYTVTFAPGAGEWRSFAVEAVQDESLPAVRLARGADRFVLTELEASLTEPGKAPRKLTFVLATTDGFGQPPDHPPMAAIDGDPKTGWGVAYGEGRSPMLALRLSEPLSTGPKSVVTVKLRHDSTYRRATIGRFRLALSPASDSWPESGEASLRSRARKEGTGILNGAPDRGLPAAVQKALAVAPESRTEAQKKTVLDHFLWCQPELQNDVVALARLEAEKSMVDASIPMVVVTEAVTPRETRILPRGNWMDDSGELVEPAVPQFLGKLNIDGRRATRLDLANWITSKDNPLTARVQVNRQWRLFFGTGLSKTLDDFGSQGEWPTHPELLDWLAAEFMDGWDMKRLVRTIVFSETYQQSSRSTPQLDERDPANRLLARQAALRVDAEVVRDIALSVSGLLRERFGGPSVRPYQPDGYLLAMNFPKRDYSASRGDDLYRRALYTHWQRTFLHPSLLAFDAASREECSVGRSNSNTPLQALVVLNDPSFVEAARVFAARMAGEGGATIRTRINWAMEATIQREATADEIRLLSGLYRRSLASYQANPAQARQLLSTGEAQVKRTTPPAQLAALTTVARAILNLHETVTRN